MQLTLVVLTFALVHFASADQQRHQPPYVQPRPPPPPQPPLPPYVQPNKTVTVVKNVNTVVLPAVPTVVSCKKTYTVKCTNQATIQYLDTHDIKRTQSCNNFTDNSDFVNSIDLRADLEALQDVLKSVSDRLNGAGQTSESDNPADQLAQFFSGQLGAARCQACCDAYASLNSGIDPSSGLGNAVSKWVPQDSSKSKRGAHGTGGDDDKSGCPNTIGTCGCCYTKQEETCIRVQDPNYNPDKYKKVPWKLFPSNSKSSESSTSSKSTSKSASNNKSEKSKPSRNETSSSSSSADDELSHSGSDSSDSGDKKPKTFHKDNAAAVPVASLAKPSQ